MPAESSTSVHEHYQLKPSRYALGFQLCCLLVMLVTVYMSLDRNQVIIFVFLASICWFLFLKQDRIEILSALDQELWSIRWLQSQQLERVKIRMIFDHQFYIVLHFESRHIRPLLIWPDQLDRKSWKSIRLRAKLI